jgi:hypothetical protein
MRSLLFTLKYIKIFLGLKVAGKRSSLLLATSNSERKRAIEEGFDPQSTIVLITVLNQY